MLWAFVHYWYWVEGIVPWASYGIPLVAPLSVGATLLVNRALQPYLDEMDAWRNCTLLMMLFGFLPQVTILVRVDAIHLEQVIMNLAVNAQDAMPGGGTLVLATENMSVPRRNASADRVAPPGDYAVLTVQDTGSCESAGPAPAFAPSGDPPVRSELARALPVSSPTGA